MGKLLPVHYSPRVSPIPAVMSMPRDDSVLANVIPLQVDSATLARFRKFCEVIGRQDEVARVAAEVFRDLVWDDEFEAENGGTTH